MIRTNEIKAQMKRKGMIQGDLAKRMNMDPSTLNRKINNEDGDKITVREVTRMCKELDLQKEQVADIFFAEELA